MVPWFKGFRGTIEELENQRYIINGELAEISDTKVEITELPIRTWTQTYKEQVKRPNLEGIPKMFLGDFILSFSLPPGYGGLPERV